MEPKPAVLVVLGDRQERRQADRRRRVRRGGRSGSQIAAPIVRQVSTEYFGVGKGEFEARREGRLMTTTAGSHRPARCRSVARVGGLLRELDLVTIGAVAGLVVMGLLSIFTATVDPEAGDAARFPGIERAVQPAARVPRAGRRDDGRGRPLRLPPLQGLCDRDVPRSRCSCFSSCSRRSETRRGARSAGSRSGCSSCSRPSWPSPCSLRRWRPYIADRRGYLGLPARSSAVL